MSMLPRAAGDVLEGARRAQPGSGWLDEMTAAMVSDTLRHFWASLLIRHDEPVKTVQALLAHASAAGTP
jgi:integrase